MVANYTWKANNHGKVRISFRQQENAVKDAQSEVYQLALEPMRSNVINKLSLEVSVFDCPEKPMEIQSGQLYKNVELSPHKFFQLNLQNVRQTSTARTVESLKQ